MDDLCICKICKKVFTDVHGLNRHKMAQHPTSSIITKIPSQQQPQLLHYNKQQKGSVNNNNNISNGGSVTSIISDSNNAIAHHHFRNNSSISITRIHKETNNSSAPQHNSAMNQNKNSFRKTPIANQNITGRRAEMKARQGEGTRVKQPFKSQTDARMKGVQASVKVGISSKGEVDDDTTDSWQKWNPSLSKDRGDSSVVSNHQTVTSTTPAPQRPGGVPLITKSAAEHATSAFSYSPGQLNSSSGATARKSVPPLLPLPSGGAGRGQSGGGKRPAPGIKVGANSQRVAPNGGVRGGATSAVADIMQNLGKMKVLASKQAVSSRPSPTPTPTATATGTNQKISSISQPTKKASAPSPSGSYGPPAKIAKQTPIQQSLKVNKSLPVSKNKSKVLPKNSFNSAASKSGGGVSRAGQTATNKRIVQPVEDDMDADSSSDEEDEDMDEDEDEDDDETGTFSQSAPPPPPPAKKTVPAPSTKAKNPPPAGKVSPTKSLQANRFNPIESAKKGKGKAAPSTPPTTTVPKGSPNGKSKPASTSPVSSTTNGTAPSVVAKKSNPPSAAASGTTKNVKNKKAPENTYKKLKAYVPTMPGTDYDMPKLTAIGSYTNRQGQQVWVCLVCNEKEQEESSRDMICCEMCDDWYHFECVGIRQQMEEDDPWYCKRCIYQTCSNPKKDFPKLFKNDLLDM